MPRTDTDSNYKPLTALVTFHLLDSISGHTRPWRSRSPSHPSPHRSSYAIARDRREASLVHRYLPVQECAPLKRNRQLTPPPTGRASLKPSQLNEQTESLLFKLPEELRCMIFQEVIGGNLFHIVRRNNSFRLGHVKCKSPHPRSQEECKESECRGLKLPTGLHAREACAGNGGLIQLLQSCRRVYIDAARLLYSSNIFDFDSMETIIMFCNSVVPARFDSIVSLQLDFRFSLSHLFSEASPQNDLDRWMRVWRIIGSMKSLQFLWVRIAWPKQVMTVREERRFMEPLCQVGELNCFEVSLPTVLGTEFQRAKEENWVVLRRKR